MLEGKFVLMRRLTCFVVLYGMVLLVAQTGLAPRLDRGDVRGKSMIWAENNFSSIPFYRRLCAGAVYAAELAFTPRLELTQEYNNNILFTEENTVSDMETRIKPEFHAAVAEENYSLTGGGFLRVREYWDENVFDTVEYSMDLSAAIQPIPRLEARASGSYLKDTTLESEIEATGLVLTRNDRWKTEGSAGLGYLVGERATLDFDATYRRVEYEDRDLVDYEATALEVSFIRVMKNERDAISALFYAADYDFDRNTTNDYGGILGYRYQITERGALQLAGGARFTRSRVETPRRTFREDEWGGLADIALSWESETGSVHLGYVLELAPTGRGEAIEKHRGYITVAYRFSERITGKVYSDYFDSKSLEDDPRIDENLFRARPSLIVRLSERIWARLSYEHARLRNNRDDTSAIRDRVYLSVTATWPGKYHFP